MRHLKLSLKQKSLLFILFLISILLLTLYVQHLTTYKNYLYLLQDSYKTSLDNNYKIFLNNLNDKYNNIRISFQSDEIYKYIKNKNEVNLKNKTEEILLNLQDYNSYLKDIKIITNTKELKYLNILKKEKKLIDVVKINGNIYFKLIYPLMDNHYEYAIIEFFIDVQSFLYNIKEYNKSDGILYFINENNETIDKYLPSVERNKDFQKLIKFCKSEQKNLLNIDSKFYVTKLFEFNNIYNEPISKIVFFLDVTKEKLEYKGIIKNSIITSILLFVFAAIIVNYFFNFLIKMINKNENKLKEINKNLEQTVENEISHRLEVQKKAKDEKEQNQQLLVQQSKLAMMGEMIGNIAHQWRQPLMQLSAILMYLDAYNEKEKLTKEKFQEKLKDGGSIIEFMSRTIEDFRNYYKPEKQKEEFLIKDSIQSALFIIDSSLKNSHIATHINYDNEDLKLVSFKNEFSQALLNIISNAKDVLLQRKIVNPTIKINVFSKNSKSYITIEDNANGIENDILDKIFDPYFTTKHKSQGTGIGLYMTKMIIQNNMNGKILVSNTKDGARFTVIL